MLLEYILLYVNNIKLGFIKCIAVVVCILIIIIIKIKLV